MTSPQDAEPASIPVVAVVGRPNVGKSTLVNRIIGRREAVVQDVPGVTRDRIAYDATWSGRDFTLVDTGGWEPDSRGLQARISAQAQRAVETADVVVFVVDGLVGATATDLSGELFQKVRCTRSHFYTPTDKATGRVIRDWARPALRAWRSWAPRIREERRERHDRAAGCQCDQWSTARSRRYVRVGSAGKLSIGGEFRHAHIAAGVSC